MEAGSGTPIQVRTVRGEPYEVAGRRLIPLARIVSAGKAKATVATDWVGGWAGGFARITPVAILEETAEGERRIPITDANAAAWRGMVTAMLSITLFCAMLRWLFRRRSRAQAGS